MNDHQKFLQRMGVNRKSDYRGDWSGSFLSIKTRETSPTSNTMGSGYKRSIDDYKWRRGAQEKANTVAEIEAKKTRVAPAFNKGGLQYITDDADPKSLGRKI